MLGILERSAGGMAGTARAVQRWTTVSALAFAGLAGCGGDSKPNAEETKARWVQRVDAACRRANEAIADRGWPVDLVDLDRLVVRGIDDAQAAIKSIAGLRVLEGAGPRPGAFVKELKALEPELTKLSEASEHLEPTELVKAAEALKPQLAAIEKSAEEAGLSDCVSHDERFFVPDAVRAPVFAEQLARLDRRLLRRIKNVDFAGAESPTELAAAFRFYSEVIDSAVDGIDRLDPPQWAAKQVGNYQVALRDLQSVSQKFTAMLVDDKDKSPYEVDRAKYVRTQKQLRRTATAEGKARRRMLKAVGAGPTMIPDPGEAADPDSEQQS
jgi:hypothetical protein